MEIERDKPKFIPPVRDDDNGWIRQGKLLYELYSVREQDVEGHCWLYAEGRTPDRLEGEWISYDEGETWQDPDMNGYW